MTPNDFGKLIKNNIHGVFLFYGEEQYLKQHYLGLVKKAVSPDGSSVMSISGEGLTLSELSSQLTDLASMPSMDMGKRFFLVYDAEWKKVSEDDIAFFEECMMDLEIIEDVVIVFDTRPESFDAGTEKKPSKLFARLEKAVKTVCFAKETPARLAGWAQKHFAAYKINAPIEVCEFLVNHSGRDMTSLNHEITKLSAYVSQKGGNTVTAEDVKLVCASVNEIDTFDFSNAILNGDTERGFSILSEMRLHKESPEMILGSITSVYSDLYAVKCLLEAGLMKGEIAKRLKLHEYKAGLYAKRAAALSKKGLEKAIELCREADIKIKGRALNEYDILDMLLIKLAMTGKLR